MLFGISVSFARADTDSSTRRFRERAVPMGGYAPVSRPVRSTTNVNRNGNYPKGETDEIYPDRSEFT